jgi:hypothetical protein
VALSLPELQAKADRAALPVDGMADYGITKPEIDVTEPNALTPLQGLWAEHVTRNQARQNLQNVLPRATERLRTA